MVSVPFFYFTFLFLYQLRRNKGQIDISCYILGIFAVSAFFSILIDAFNLRSIDTYSYKISFTATISYCALITLCTIPFMLYSNLKIRHIEPVKNSGLLKSIAVIFFLFSLINFVFSIDNIVNVITSDDMSQIRSDHYAGYDEETWISKLPFIARLPFIPLRMVSACSWIFVFLAFYSIVIQKLSKTYAILYLFASVNGIIESINQGGRSAMIFWLIGALACFVFFRPFMIKKQKALFYRVITIIAALFVAYIAAMTISRFGERNFGEIDGSQGGLITYTGQPFINFCYYFDTFDCPAPSLQIIFPLTYQIIGYPIQGAGAVQELLSAMTGKQIGVFYTFIGQIIVSSNNFVGVLYCIVLFFISINAARRVRMGRATIARSYFFLLCSSVLFLGLFGHYYSYAAKTFSMIFWLIFFSLLKPIGASSSVKLN